LRARRNNDESLNKTPSQSPSPQRNDDQGAPEIPAKKSGMDEETKKEIGNIKDRMNHFDEMLGKIYEVVSGRNSRVAPHDLSLLSDDNSSRMSASSLTVYKPSPVAQLFSPSSESMQIQP
jgi:hypothetical protein